MKKSVIIFFGFLAITVFVFPYLKIEYEIIEDADLFSSSVFEIFINNSLIVVSIYITSLFTKAYGYFIYAINGLILGVAVSLLIMNNDLAGAMLLLPHCIIEIPSVLMASSIMDKTMEYWKDNKKLYLSRLVINLILILVSALVEVYITPLAYYLVLK